MPDLTISFTDAQWTRIVAASGAFKWPGVITEDEMTVLLQTQVASTVKDYELQHATPTEF